MSHRKGRTAWASMPCRPARAAQSASSRPGPRAVQRAARNGPVGPAQTSLRKNDCWNCGPIKIHRSNAGTPPPLAPRIGAVALGENARARCRFSRGPIVVVSRPITSPRSMRSQDLHVRTHPAPATCHAGQGGLRDSSRASSPRPPVYIMPCTAVLHAKQVLNLT